MKKTVALLLALCIVVSCAHAVFASPPDGTLPRDSGPPTIILHLNGGNYQSSGDFQPSPTDPDVLEYQNKRGKPFALSNIYPNKEKYEFKGWYTSPSFEDGTLAPNSVIQGIFYAKWEKSEDLFVTITFDSDGGNAIAPMKVRAGEPFTLPEPPVRAGFLFKCWRLPDGQQLTDDSVLQQSVTVKADWEKVENITHNVRFEENNGTSRYSERTAEDGTCITDFPQAPEKTVNGVTYQFTGWYTEPSSGEPFTAFTPVTANLTVYAHWILPSDASAQIAETLIQTDDPQTALEAIGQLKEISNAELVKNTEFMHTQLKKMEENYAAIADITMHAPKTDPTLPAELGNAASHAAATGALLSALPHQTLALEFTAIPDGTLAPDTASLSKKLEALVNANSQATSEIDMQTVFSAEIRLTCVAGGETGAAIPLAVPVTLRMPVPVTYAAAPANLRVFHFGENSIETITPRLLSNNTAIEFDAASLSPFVFASVTEKKNENGDNDPDGGDHPDDGNDPDDGSGNGSSGGSGAGSGSSGGGSSGGRIAAAGGSRTTVQAVTTAQAKNKVAKAINTAKAAGRKNAAVSFSSPVTLSPTVMQTVAKEAAKAGFTPVIQADTKDGALLIARLQFTPTQNLQPSSVKTGVTAGNKAVESVFKRYFINDVQVFQMAQKGDYGVHIDTALRLNQTMQKADRLYVYHYIPASNKYALLSPANIFVDVNGFIHFSISSGDTYIITDNPLTRK